MGTNLLAPFIIRYLERRLSQGKEDPARFRERLGFPGRPRPTGRLIWFHAASVGEAISVLPLIEGMLDTYPDAHALLTTGTVTSAKMIAKRLPERTQHQYVPIDRVPCVRTFLDHWRPDMAVWVESEFWPNLIWETRQRDIPMLLVNARVSSKSFERWRRMPTLIRPVLGAFDLCLTQSVTDIGRLSALGANHVCCQGNLKDGAPPLPYDEAEWDKLARQMGDRPRWLAASTHNDEEATAGRIHLALKRDFPGLVTIIVPRHQHRGEALARELRSMGLKVRRRRGLEPIDDVTDIYLADTMGELGLFYRLSPIVFIGGSLIPHGGQNPLEAARLGCAVLVGPHMENFPDTMRTMLKDGAIRQTADADGLESTVRTLLRDEKTVSTLGDAGLRATAEGARVVDRILDEIAPYLEPMVEERERARA